jgi:hypothetical protein
MRATGGGINEEMNKKNIHAAVRPKLSIDKQ